MGYVGRLQGRVYGSANLPSVDLPLLWSRRPDALR